MFIAHLGLGLAAKRVAPRVSLGVLLLSSQALDIICGLLMVTGIEQMKVTHGITRMTPLEFVSYPWSHGLLMSLIWSALAGLLAALRYRELRSSLVVSALVFSHWVLDWISHRPDLPLFFAGSPKLGLGLWNHVAATMLVEFGLFALGVVVVLRSTRSRDRWGNWALGSFVVFFAGMFLMNHYGPPPPVGMPQQILGLFIFVFVLLLPWGHWIDTHRAPRLSAPAARR